MHVPHDMVFVPHDMTMSWVHVLGTFGFNDVELYVEFIRIGCSGCTLYYALERDYPVHDHTTVFIKLKTKSLGDR